MEMIGQLHDSGALPPEKLPRYPLDRRLGGPQSRSASCEGKCVREIWDVSNLCDGKR
jgi:hypothetical protein